MPQPKKKPAPKKPAPKKKAAAKPKPKASPKPKTKASPKSKTQAKRAEVKRRIKRGQKRGSQATLLSREKRAERRRLDPKGRPTLHQRVRDKKAFRDYMGAVKKHGKGSEQAKTMRRTLLKAIPGSGRYADFRIKELHGSPKKAKSKAAKMKRSPESKRSIKRAVTGYKTQLKKGKLPTKTQKAAVKKKATSLTKVERAKVAKAAGFKGKALRPRVITTHTQKKAALKKKAAETIKSITGKDVTKAAARYLLRTFGGPAGIAAAGAITVGGMLEKHHERSLAKGRKKPTALSRVRKIAKKKKKRERQSAKAGKPIYGSWSKATEADRDWEP